MFVIELNICLHLLFEMSNWKIMLKILTTQVTEDNIQSINFRQKLKKEEEERTNNANFIFVPSRGLWLSSPTTTIIGIKAFKNKNKRNPSVPQFEYEK